MKPREVIYIYKYIDRKISNQKPLVLKVVIDQSRLNDIAAQIFAREEEAKHCDN